MREGMSVMRRVVQYAVWTLLSVAACLHVGAYDTGVGLYNRNSRNTRQIGSRFSSQPAWLRSGIVRSHRANSTLNPYFANDTFLGRPVTCSPKERECLIYNRIYSEAHNGCYPLGDGPTHCLMAVNRYHFEMTGHITGYCAPMDPCRDLTQKSYRMAFDGSCVRHMNLNTVCGPGPINVVPHYFGDSECKPVHIISGPEPVYISQPSDESQCTFPNLRDDLSSVMRQESRVLIKACSDLQQQCFNSNKVYCSATRRCCDLFERESCSPGEWITINKTAWDEGTVEAGCLQKYPCGSSAHRMAFDGQCYEKDEILRVLCPGGVLLPNIFGEMSCVTRDFYKHYLFLGHVLGSICEFNQRISYDTISNGIRLKVDCSLRNDENCLRTFE